MTSSRLEQVLEEVRESRFPELDPELVREIYLLHVNSAPKEEALIKKTRRCIQEWIRSEVSENQ